MMLVSISNAIFQIDKENTTKAFSLRLQSGEHHDLKDQEARYLLDYLTNIAPPKLLSGSIKIAKLAFIMRQPPGLDHLKSADFLRRLFLVHQPDCWDNFRPILSNAIKELGEGSDFMAKKMGQLSDAQKTTLEYLALSLKPWRTLILKEHLKPKQALYINSLIEKNKGCCLKMMGEFQ